MLTDRLRKSSRMDMLPLRSSTPRSPTGLRVNRSYMGGGGAGRGDKGTRCIQRGLRAGRAHAVPKPELLGGADGAMKRAQGDTSRPAGCKLAIVHDRAIRCGFFFKEIRTTFCAEATGILAILSHPPPKAGFAPSDVSSRVAVRLAARDTSGFAITQGAAWGPCIEAASSSSIAASWVTKARRDSWQRCCWYNCRQCFSVGRCWGRCGEPSLSCDRNICKRQGGILYKK